MAKGSGNTRASASGSPRGLGGGNIRPTNGFSLEYTQRITDMQESQRQAISAIGDKYGAYGRGGRSASFAEGDTEFSVMGVHEGNFSNGYDFYYETHINARPAGLGTFGTREAENIIKGLESERYTTAEKAYKAALKVAKQLNKIQSR